jgi:hypothetical protein
MELLIPFIDQRQDALYPSVDGFLKFRSNGIYCSLHVFLAGPYCGPYLLLAGLHLFLASLCLGPHPFLVGVHPSLVSSYGALNPNWPAFISISNCSNIWFISAIQQSNNPTLLTLVAM